ncbi:RNA-binding S4 domain-containing protein [Caulobacter sp. S45]|uniref:RNA-binding S4 domain-containing protein n=1 Tax=Caulobacter sp. S45 TaxID=1641861 RepID=UPI0015765B51|nr:RNA-binding S4 domain-containing protein [Caulobacter sp. S45]
MTEAVTSEPCRLDVWLWRARFFKTRSLASRFIEEGRVRLHRDGAEARIDKPSRAVRVGDGLVFALGGRVVAISVADPGSRRGPAVEARTLYVALDEA